MNVYDFDNTIYDGDSTIDFYFYCLKKNPNIIKRLPKQIVSFLKYKTGRIDKTLFKEIFFSFLSDLEEPTVIVNDFWNVNIGKIKKWYKEQQKKEDLVISASPHFLLKPACERIGVSYLLASEIDITNGNFKSKNCYGEEKVRRFQLEYGNRNVENFYSDSYSDEPMAELADKAFLVKGNRIIGWKEGRKY